MTWRQVGWFGQSGRVYADHYSALEGEPGGFSPWWVYVGHNSAVTGPWDNATAQTADAHRDKRSDLGSGDTP